MCKAKDCWEMESSRGKWHLGPGVGAQGGARGWGVHELGSTGHSVP